MDKGLQVLLRSGTRGGRGSALFIMNILALLDF